MTWNYRVVRHGPEDAPWLSVHAVYYDKNGKIDSWCEKSAWPGGETLEELRRDAEAILRAATHTGYGEGKAILLASEMPK